MRWQSKSAGTRSAQFVKGRARAPVGWLGLRTQSSLQVRIQEPGREAELPKERVRLTPARGELVDDKLRGS